MAFLKALTLFLVCISIFKITVSQYQTCNVRGKPNCNVLLSGTFKCPPCISFHGYGRVIIYLEEKYLTEHIYTICKGNFYIEKYLQKPHPEDYKASFYYFCSSPPLTKTVKNQNPRFIGEVNGTYYYKFETIDFT